MHDTMARNKLLRAVQDIRPLLGEIVEALEQPTVDHREVKEKLDGIETEVAIAKDAAAWLGL
jgi:cell division septum initiation protein DivIVA